MPERSGGEPVPGKKKGGRRGWQRDTFSLGKKKRKETCCCDLLVPVLYLFFCQVIKFILFCGVLYDTGVHTFTLLPSLNPSYYYYHTTIIIIFIIIFPFSSQLRLQPWAAQSTRKTRLLFLTPSPVASQPVKKDKGKEKKNCSTQLFSPLPEDLSI